MVRRKQSPNLKTEKMWKVLIGKNEKNVTTQKLHVTVKKKKGFNPPVGAQGLRQSQQIGGNPQNYTMFTVFSHWQTMASSWPKAVLNHSQASLFFFS